MTELYRNAADDVPQVGFTFDSDALAAALERLYRKKFDPKAEVDKGLFNAIRTTLDDGIERGFAPVSRDRYRDFLAALKGNSAVFAAFKTHRMQNDIAGQLLDENGELKPFAKFKADVAGMTSHHVGRWLRTEYDTAVLRAHAAADWKQFELHRNIMPNLRWNRSTSLEPRAGHRVFWGRVWHIDDPHWNRHRPGDEWGCKCSLSATADPPTDNSDLTASLPKPSPGLGGNPGVTAKIFSDDHPYIANAHKGAKRAVGKLLKELDLTPEEVVEKVFKSGGVLQIPKGLKQNPQEEKKNLKAYTELAKMHGEHYKLLGVTNEHGRKNPDAINLRTGRYSDVKNPQSDNGKNAVQAAIKEASQQRVGEVYIYLIKDYPRKDIYAGLKSALQGGRARSINDIIIRFHDGELRRYDADKLRTLFK